MRPDRLGFPCGHKQVNIRRHHQRSPVCGNEVFSQPAGPIVPTATLVILTWGTVSSSDSAAETPDCSASRLEIPAADHGSHLKSPPYS